MKKKSLFTMVASLALVGAIGIGATFAYLSDTTDEVVNTFTVGAGYEDQSLKLDEAPVDRDEDGKLTADFEADRVKTNEYTNLQPGEIIPKDPMVTLEAGSPKSYLFVSFDNVDEVVAALCAGVSGIDWNVAEWTKYDNGTGMDGVYYTVVDATATDANGAAVTELFTHTFFNNIVIDSAKTQMPQSIPEITVKAVAIQYAGFENAEAAYNEVAANL